MADTKIDIQKGGRRLNVYGGWGQQNNATKTNYITVEMPAGEVAVSADFKGNKVVVTMASGMVREYDTPQHGTTIKQGTASPTPSKKIEHDQPKEKKVKPKKEGKSFWSPWWAIPFKMIWGVFKGLWWILKKLIGK